MKAIIIVFVATIIVACATLGMCSEEEDDLGKRQYDCPYMWMMMNAGPQPTGFNPWLLLFLGIGVVLLSRDLLAGSKTETAIEH